MGGEQSRRSSNKVQHQETAQVNPDGISCAKMAFNVLSNQRNDGDGDDKEQAISFLKKRSLKGDGEAMWLLGLCFEFGIGMEQDISQAELFYYRSGKAGDYVGEFISAHSQGGRGTGVMKVKCLRQDRMTRALF